MQNQTGKDFEITEKMTKIVSVIKGLPLKKNWVETSLKPEKHCILQEIGWRKVELKAEQGRSTCD